jgi:hypothetical protein
MPGGRGDYPVGGVPGTPEGPEDPNLTLLITQTTSELRIERRRGPALGGRPIVQVFAFDGNVKSNPDDLGRGIVQSKARWSKSKLVVEGTQSIAWDGQDYQLRIKRELSLSKDGQVLTIKTSLHTPTGPVGIKQTFRKSSPAGTSIMG